MNKIGNIILVILIFGMAKAQVNKPKPINNGSKIAIKPILNTPVLTYDSKSGKYVKTSPKINGTEPQRIFVPAHQYVWVLSQTGTPAHWERPKVEDKNYFNKTNSFFLIKFNTKVHQGFPYYKNNKGEQKSVSYRSFSIGNLKENLQFLGKSTFQSDALTGVVNKTNVFYFQKIEPSVISFNSNEEYILVADTLVLPNSIPLNNSFIGIKPYEENPKLPLGISAPPNLPLNVKIIAGTVIVQGISNISLPQKSIFQIASNIFLLKTPFKKITKTQLNELPVALNTDNSKENHVFINGLNQNDQILLNRLYLEQLKLINEVSINSTNDAWTKDKIIERFQTIRYQKIKTELLNNDSKSSMYASQCEKFERGIQNYNFSRKRNFNGTVILCDGNINEMPIVPIKYYALPTQATILPVQIDTSQRIGHIKYDPNLNKVNKIEIEVELGHNQVELNKIKTDLSKKGIKIEGNLPITLLKIDEQALKINGKTMGRIFPISNNLIKLEIDLIEDGNSIIQLFPKVGNVAFDVESTLNNDASKLVSRVNLILPNKLLKKLDYGDPIKSFDIYENSDLTHEIKLENNLFSTDKNTENEVTYGALTYLEVIVEIVFSDHSTIRGPYKLSSYNTFSSSTMVPFLKREPNYAINISGRALYESGIREIKPFSINSDIVSIDESMLNN